MNELKPYEPIHPGEMLREELEARKIKQKDFAELIQLSYSMLSEILNGKKPISADVALRLEAALGVKARFSILGLSCHATLSDFGNRTTLFRAFDD